MKIQPRDTSASYPSSPWTIWSTHFRRATHLPSFCCWCLAGWRQGLKSEYESMVRGPGGRRLWLRKTDSLKLNNSMPFNSAVQVLSDLYHLAAQDRQWLWHVVTCCDYIDASSYRWSHPVSLLVSATWAFVSCNWSRRARWMEPFGTRNLRRTSSAPSSAEASGKVAKLECAAKKCRWTLEAWHLMVQTNVCSFFQRPKQYLLNSSMNWIVQLLFNDLFHLLIF